MQIAALLFVAFALADNAPFQEGLKAYDDIEYEDAIAKFQEAANVPGITNDDKAEVFLWLGVSHGQLGQFDAAKTAFDTAFTMNTNAAIATTLPPKVSEVLEASRQEAIDREAAAAAAQAPPPPPKPVEEPLPVLLIAGGATAGVGALVLLGGLGLMGLSVATAQGLDDRTEFQSVIKEKMDAANLQLGLGAGLTLVGLAVAGAGGAIVALDLME